MRKSELAAATAFAATVLAILTTSTVVGLGIGQPIQPLLLYTLHTAALIGSLCIGYAIFVEPRRLTTQTLTLKSPKLSSPIRAVHLTDLHVSEWNTFHERLLEAVRDLKPDLILMTGDYTTSRFNPEALKRFLTSLAGIAPVTACLGNSEGKRAVHETMQINGLQWLPEGSVSLEVRGQQLQVDAAIPGDLERVFSAKPDAKTFSICLYHYPDPAAELERVPYDLTLSGHTHGGQVRLPFIGALFSNSHAGRRYARGVFRSGTKTAFVSQGIGCESYGLPPIRFMCPPEIAILDLGPSLRG